jgi:hypothetical protein
VSRSPSNPLRAVFACGLLAAGTAGAQVVEDPDEEARLPYEHLHGRQNEIRVGAASELRDRSAARDVRTRSTVAFMAFSRGVTERLELGVGVPFVLYSEQTRVRENGVVARSEGPYGVSDPTLRARYALRQDDRGIAVTLGLLATPDWGGRSRSSNAAADSVEPFVVLGRSVGAGKAYLRYGYLEQSGASRFTVGGRYPLGTRLGVLANVSYLRTPASDGATVGGYAELVNGMQLTVSVGGSRGDVQAADGRVDEARRRQWVLSLAHRF